MSALGAERAAVVIAARRYRRARIGVEAAYAALCEAIRAAAAAGSSERSIAAVVGVSHGRIHQILGAAR